MANEQVLSDFTAPSFNGIAAQRVLSNETVKNIYQGLIESDGKGVTTRFSYDTTSPEIRILRVKPVKQFARRLGAAVNGGNFPITAYEGETDSFGLRVLDIMDNPIDLARVSKEMIPVDLAAAYIKSYTDQVLTQINGITLAGKFYATTVKEATGGEVNVTKYEGEDLLGAVLDANSLLDEGVEDMDVAMFPPEDRCFTIQASYRSTLLKKGILTIGGANSAYAITEKGTVSEGVAPRKLNDGFIGYVDGVECHIVSSLIYKTAAEYLGLAKGDVAQAIGCISSSFANVRGISAVDSVKVIDHPNGQGTRMQPYTRWGFTVLPGYEKGNSFIVSKDYANPFAGLVKLFGLTDYRLFEVLPVGSRVSLGATFSSSAATKFTVTCPNAYKIAVVADAKDEIKSIADFVKAYDSSASDVKSNSVTSGGVVTLAGLTSGEVVKVLCMAADGTCELSKGTMK